MKRHVSLVFSTEDPETDKGAQLTLLYVVPFVSAMRNRVFDKPSYIRRLNAYRCRLGKYEYMILLWLLPRKNCAAYACWLAQVAIRDFRPEAASVGEMHHVWI